MNSLKTLTAERLRELLHFDPQTGVFTWRAGASKQKPGRVAGALVAEGYIRIRVDYRLYMAHRLAWLYVYSKWPAKQIDHENRVRSDNRLSNLREATQSENSQNTLKLCTNKSGHKGVFFDGTRKKWCSRIGFDGKETHLGYFTDVKAAAKAYVTASANHHTRNPVSGSII